jgi:hypothetical protein
MVRIATSFGVLVACGCGDGAIGMATFDDVCGEDGPVRLLPLADDRQLFVTRSSVQRIGERIFFGAFPVDDEAGIYAGTEVTTLYATGLCGESPGVVAENIGRVWEREAFPGVALGCAREETDDVVVVDPFGDAPPRVVFTAPACTGQWGRHGIVSVEGRGNGTGAVLFQAYPADLEGPPVEPIVLLDGIHGYDMRAIDAFDDEVFAEDLNGDLVRIALPGGETTVEQPAVAAALMTPDGRHLLYFRSAEEVAESVWRGDIVIRNRATGDELAFDDVLMVPSLSWGDDGFARFWLGPEIGQGRRLVHLETLEVYELPDDRAPWRLLGDGRWLVRATSSPRWRIRDIESDEETLFPQPHHDISADLWTFDPAWIEFVDGPDLTGPLRRIDLATAASELMARRARYGYRRFADGRIVTMLDTDPRDPDGLGTVIVVDRDTLEESIVEPHAWASLLLTSSDLDLDDDDLVLYGVRDGDRSGLWMARISK